jgi:hypothetical protein
MGSFSKFWGRVGTLQGVLDADLAPIDNYEDPVHAERMMRYRRNLLYYLQAQYDDMNASLFLTDSPNVWAKARVNYTGVVQQTIDTKADWLYGQPPQVQFEAVGADLFAADAEDYEKDEQNAVLKRLKSIREHNELDFWDWMSAVVGMICGDYFWYIYSNPETGEVECELMDPMLVFPLYSRNLAVKILPALQMVFYRYVGNSEQVLVTRDWRLEPAGLWDRSVRTLQSLPVMPDAMLMGDTSYLTCIHRKFEDGVLVSQEDIGRPYIPWVHGVNQVWGRSRYGMDEVTILVPKVEKYNDLMRYAERIARVNANAKLGIVGARPGKLKADADDVIYFPEGSDAKVISLPSDTGVLNFIRNELKETMYKDAGVPLDALGEGDAGANIPALSLELKFSRLVQITRRHRMVYGTAFKARDKMLLDFDEQFGEGSMWSRLDMEEQLVWYDAMPKSRTAAVTDGGLAAPGKQLVSVETIQSWIPGVDPNKENARLETERQQAQQAMLAQQQALMQSMGSQEPGAAQDAGIDAAVDLAFGGTGEIAPQNKTKYNQKQAKNATSGFEF